MPERPISAVLERDWRANPRPGDVIRVKGGGRAAREIIDVDRLTDEVHTTGMSGIQRNRWMKRSRLARYELIRPAERSITEVTET